MDGQGGARVDLVVDQVGCKLATGRRDAPCAGGEGHCLVRRALEWLRWWEHIASHSLVIGARADLARGRVESTQVLWQLAQGAVARWMAGCPACWAADGSNDVLMDALARTTLSGLTAQPIGFERQFEMVVSVLRALSWTHGDAGVAIRR